MVAEADGIRRWLELYTAVARRNGGEPEAGRRLTSWAAEAGLVDVRASASSWTYTSAEERSWLAGSWAARLRESLAGQAAVLGWTGEDVDAMAQGWLAWAAEPAGWFGYVHVEVLGTPFSADGVRRQPTGAGLRTDIPLGV